LIVLQKTIVSKVNFMSITINLPPDLEKDLLCQTKTTNSHSTA